MRSGGGMELHGDWETYECESKDTAFDSSAESCAVMGGFFFLGEDLHVVGCGGGGERSDEYGVFEFEGWLIVVVGWMSQLMF